MAKDNQELMMSEGAEVGVDGLVSTDSVGRYCLYTKKADPSDPMCSFRLTDELEGSKELLSGNVIGDSDDVIEFLSKLSQGLKVLFG